MLRPDALPRPPDYGYLGEMKLPRIEVRLPEVQSPEDAWDYLEPYRQPVQVPDVVRVRYGAGDKATVGELLRIANGEASDLLGVSPSYASELLTGWGYPTSMDAWTADQWEASIGSRALEPNPLTLLNGFGG